MAIAFVRGNVISRQKGQSVVASAAYRACENLYDERHDKEHDYKSKAGHIDGGLILPNGINWTREELWNKVEAFEKRIDARLAKEIMVALPKELFIEENKALSIEIAKLVSREIKEDGQEEQYCVDWNMHEPHKEAVMDEEGNYILDQDGKKIMEDNENIHLHILISERAWNSEEETFKNLKDRNRNSKEWMAELKLKIGELMNRRLREKGVPEVDFRCFEIRNEEAKQKIGKELEAPQEHHGPVKTNVERKRRNRINRLKRELKMVQGELARIRKNELNQKKSESKKSTVRKPDLSIWKKNSTDTKKNNVSKVDSKPSMKVIAIPSEKKKPAKKPIPSIPVSSTFMPSISPSMKKASVGNQNGPEVQCFLCGYIEKPECKKCRFRDKDNEVSVDSGY